MRVFWSAWVASFLASHKVDRADSVGIRERERFPSGNKNTPRNQRCYKMTAFAGGFGNDTSKRAAKQNKNSRRPKRGLSDLAPPVASTESMSVQLDKWGLPPPTAEDIFPALPPGTELIPARKSSTEHTLTEIRKALKDHFPLTLDRFDDNGVETSTLDGREPMRLRMLHQSPPVIAIDHFLTPDECLNVEHAAMPPSSTPKHTEGEYHNEAVRVNSATFSPLAQSKRTSTSWFCYYSQVPTLLAKAHHVLGILFPQMEEPQIVRYKTGEEFSWHYDEVPTPQLGNGGQRLATLLVYLNTVERGGGTVFRDLRTPDGSLLTMQPVQGSALMFFPAYADGRPDDRTLHKGEMAADEKRIVQMWIHERPYTAAVPMGNSQEAAIEAIVRASRDLCYTP
jgi:prolyl 4-hydroxylase